MRHFFTFVGSATMAALSLLGCSSDDDSGGSNNGGSNNGGSNNGGSNNGGSGGSAPSQCVGNYHEFTSAEFLAQTEPGKGCSSTSDASTVCANDMPVIVGQCGASCLGMSDEATCVAGCIESNLSPKSEPLSQGCLACYGADIQCAKTHCLLKCGSAPTSDDCAACRSENGCAAAFYDCSGLPEPGVPDGAAGEGGS